jgi:hypothetical protein
MEELCLSCNGFYFSYVQGLCVDCQNASDLECANCSGFAYEYFDNGTLVDYTNSTNFTINATNSTNATNYTAGMCTPCYAVTDYFYCLGCPGFQFIDSLLSCIVCDVAN